MSEVNRIEVDEQLQYESRICKEGVVSPFWEVVKGILLRLENEAKGELVYCDPSEVSQIAQRQAICRVVKQLITVVESTATLT